MKTHALAILLLANLVTLVPAAEPRPPQLPAGADLARDVPYVTGAHERQKLDVAFFADGPPRPLIVWIHGGAFSSGDKSEAAEVWGGPLERGFAVASINYRLSGDAKWPAQITDCKAALRFLRARAKDYNLDPARIAVWGSSAGGHLAALVGASRGVAKFDVGEHLDQSSAVSCVVDMFGPVDFEKMPKRDDPNSPEGRMWGRATSAAPELAREASPLTYLSQTTPPFLILHGDADTTIDLEQSALFHAALQKAGALSEFITLPGVAHQRVTVWQKERTRILAFFEKHLRHL